MDRLGGAMFERRAQSFAAHLVAWAMLSCISANAVASTSPAPDTHTQDAILVEEASALLWQRWPTPYDQRDALQKLREALALNPNNPVTYYVLARYHAVNGYIDDDHYRPGALEHAAAATQDAIRVDPQYAEAFIYAGYLHTRLKNYAEAQQSFDRARVLRPHSAWLDVNQAELYWRQNRLEQAARLAQGVATNPSHDKKPRWYALRQWLQIACAQEDRDLAQAIYQTQLELFPADASIPGNYALYLIQYMGDFETGIEKAREALQINADYAQARKTLALGLYGRWATLIHELASVEAAERAFDEADSLYYVSAVSADPQLGELAKLRIIRDALNTTNRFDDGTRPFHQFSGYLWRQARRALKSSGIQGSWRKLLLPELAALSLLLYFGYRKRRRSAQAIGPANAPEPLPIAAALPLRFTGSGREYFKIWVINVLLTIVTLGVYSAWAKVRKLKYFYRNTELADSRFEYHGEPLAILKGRVVGVALLVAYHYAFRFSITAAIITLSVLALALPWLIRSSLRFRLRYSSYRGLRFSFRGSPAHAYYVVLVGVAGSLVSLYALAPFFHQRLKIYQHNNAFYGQARFSFSQTFWPFYRIYLGSALLGFLCMVGFTAIIIGYAAWAGQTLVNDAAVKTTTIYALLATVAFAGLFIAPYFNARLQNLIWNSTRLGEHRFTSTLSARRLLWIYGSNFIAVAATAGFFMPWAAVRLARYKAQAMALLPASDLGEIVADTVPDASAAGQETVDFFDIDISL